MQVNMEKCGVSNDEGRQPPAKRQRTSPAVGGGGLLSGDAPQKWPSSDFLDPPRERLPSWGSHQVMNSLKMSDTIDRGGGGGFWSEGSSEEGEGDAPPRKERLGLIIEEDISVQLAVVCDDHSGGLFSSGDENDDASCSSERLTSSDTSKANAESVAMTDPSSNSSPEMRSSGQSSPKVHSSTSSVVESVSSESAFVKGALGETLSGEDNDGSTEDLRKSQRLVRSRLVKGAAGGSGDRDGAAVRTRKRQRSLRDQGPLPATSSSSVSESTLEDSVGEEEQDTAEEEEERGDKATLRPRLRLRASTGTSPSLAEGDTSEADSKSDIAKRRKSELSQAKRAKLHVVRWIRPADYTPSSPGVAKSEGGVTSSTENQCISHLSAESNFCAVQPPSSVCKDEREGDVGAENAASIDNSVEGNAGENGEKSVESVAADVMTIYRRVPWLNLGIDHPERLAEAQSLASVSLPTLPPNLELRLPLEVVELGFISNPQLECVIHASNCFRRFLPSSHRQGYFLGEGTGCGKGRIIAASIWHLWNCGYRRHLWLSISNDLVQDAIRDLKDIGAGHIPVLDLGSIKVVDLDSDAGMLEAASRVARLNSLWEWEGEGVVFCTYTLLARSVNLKERESVLESVSSRATEFCPEMHKAVSAQDGGSRAFQVDDEDDVEIIEDDDAPPAECVMKREGDNRQLNAAGDSEATKRLRSEVKEACLLEPEPDPLCQDFTVTTRLGQVIKWMSNSSDFDEKYWGGVKAKYDRFFRLQCRGHKQSELWKKTYCTFRPEANRCGGLLSFDEAHKAKNLFIWEEGRSMKAPKSTAAGLMVQLLQDLLRHCPVMYASATGATEIRNMAYMSRLGLWGKGATFSDFHKFKGEVERGGVAAMECLAMDLKAAGMYSCRTLSFCNVTFNSELVLSTSEFTECYNQVAEVMRALYRLVQAQPGIIAATSSNSKPKAVNNKRLEGSPLGLFWGAQQRVFKQLLVSQKIGRTVDLARAAVARGGQVVISLWGTGESRTSEKIRELKEQQQQGKTKKIGKGRKRDASEDDEVELDDFLSPPKLMLEKLISHALSQSQESTEDWAIELRRIASLIDAINFPNNPLDDLIDRLGGPSKVAEMSGRSKRLIWEKNRIRYVARDSGFGDNSLTSNLSDRGLASVNLREQELFQKGIKRVAVITEAASAGISLHSDNGRSDSRPREMICLELPWAADKAVQQFGRVHRSNQKYSPTYHLLVSDVGGERRFVACIAHRMKTLGALTRGDRRAAFGGRTKEERLAGVSVQSQEKVEKDLGDADKGDLSICKDDESCAGEAADSSSGEKENSDEESSLPLLDFDIYSKWGMQARLLLFRWLRTNAASAQCVRLEAPKVAPPPCVGAEKLYATLEAFATDVLSYMKAAGVIEDVDGSGSKKRELPAERGKKEMDKFLNRLLSLPIELQNALFDFFNQIHDELLDDAKGNGTYDRGLESLNYSFGTPYQISVAHKEVLYSAPSTGAKTTYYHLNMDRGVSWEYAVQMLSRAPRQDYEGFYWVPHRGGVGFHTDRAFTVLILKRQSVGTGSQRVVIFKPHIGASPLLGRQQATLDVLEDHGWYKALDEDIGEVEKQWRKQHNDSKDLCYHKQIGVACRGGSHCQFGRRNQSEHILVGNIILLWSRLERWLQTEQPHQDETVEQSIQPAAAVQRVLGDREGSNRRLRLVKANVPSVPPLIGARIPADKVGMIRRNLLMAHSEKADLSGISRIEARYCIYSSDHLFAKLVEFVLEATGPFSLDGVQVLPLDSIYSSMMDAFDGELAELKAGRKGLTGRWSQHEIETVMTAYPAAADGLDAFDTYLRQFTHERRWPCGFSRSCEGYTVTFSFHRRPYAMLKSKHEDYKRAIRDLRMTQCEYHRHVVASHRAKQGFGMLQQLQSAAGSHYGAAAFPGFGELSSTGTELQVGRRSSVPFPQTAGWAALPLPTGGLGDFVDIEDDVAIEDEDDDVEEIDGIHLTGVPNTKTLIKESA